MDIKGTEGTEETKDKPPKLNVKEWIKSNLVYGDTYADFMSLIDEKAIDDACGKASFTLFRNLDEHEADWKFFFDELVLRSPFAGWIKKPHQINYIWEDIQQGLGFGDKENDAILELLKCLRKDGMSKEKIEKIKNVLYDPDEDVSKEDMDKITKYINDD